MSEARWRHRDAVSEAMFNEGGWQWHSSLGHVRTCPTVVGRKISFGMFLSNVTDDSALMVYGPISDSPKPPPKLRRFTAMHNEHGTVSGVFTVNEDNGDRLRYGVHFFNDMGAVEFRWCVECQLSDIQWLDKE
jgi:hypothetical protein